MSGPASVVANVVAARASPVIQTSGLSIDQSLPLTADRSPRRRGEPGQGRARQRPCEDPGLRRPGARSPSWSTRSSPATPAAGFEIATVTVDPPAVNVQGNAERLAALQSIDTATRLGLGRVVHRGHDRRTRPARRRLAGRGHHGRRHRRRSGRSRPRATSRSATAYVGADIDLRYSVPVDRVVDRRRRLEGRPRPPRRLDPRRRPRRQRPRPGHDRRGRRRSTSRPGLTLVSATPATIPVTVTAPPPPSPSPSAAPAWPRPPRPRPAEPSMARLFGTDGIRGVANVDLKPTLAYALGRATAHRLVGPGKSPRGRPGHAALGRHVRRGGRGRRRQPRGGRPSGRGRAHARARVPRRERPVRGGDHGLGLAQPGRRQRAQGARRRRPQARRFGRGRARAAHLALGRPRRRDERRPRADRRQPRPGRRLPAPPARARGERPGHRHAPRARRRQRLGRRRSAPRSCGRPAPRSMSSMPSPTASTSISGAAPPTRPRSPRRSWPGAPTSGSRSTATPTG